MPSLTSSRTRVLEALANYHYLTTPQLAEKLGIREKAVSRLITGFGKNPAEIGCISFGPHPNRHPNIYFLKAKGARIVGELWRRDDVFFPRVARDLAISSDSPHRSQVIGFRLLLDRHAAATGGSVEFFDPYYRCLGANHSLNKADRLRKLTRIDFPKENWEEAGQKMFWSDAAFALRTKAGKRVLGLVEVHRGDDTKRILKQLELHILALELGLGAEKYKANGLPQSNMVLLVFDDDSAMHNVLKRLLPRDDLEEFARLIACSTLARLGKNFQDWWYVREGEIRGGGLL